MHSIKQPIHYTLRQTQQDILKSPYLESPLNPSLKDLRSLSKNKKKLRYHLFKNKNLVTQNNFYSPNRPEQTKTYASYLNLPSPFLQPKPTIRITEDKFNSKRTQKKEGSLAKQEQQPERKEKKQFKLIHQIKKEKLKLAKQKIEEQSSDIYNQKVAHIDQIEAKGAKKMQIFVQELHDILHLSNLQKSQPPELGSASASKVVESQMRRSLEQSVNIDHPLMQVKKGQDPIKESELRQPLQIIEESYRQPDLNRSCLKAQRILRQRKDSGNSSMDISSKQSKIREEMNISLALESINNTKLNMSELFKDMIDTHKGKGKTSKTGTADRIRIHICVLQTMSNFVYQSTKFDIVTEEWEQLNFLIYKKYYIERVKVLNFINKYPMRNPFAIYNAEITSKEVIDFMKTEEGGAFRTQIVKETAEIRARLSNFYSHFNKAKVGEKINLFQYDNFSHWIIEELWAELILTEYNTNHEQEVVKSRMCRILQLIFLISQLNGKYQFPFEEAESAIKSKNYQSYIKEGKQIFEKYILYKST